MEYDLRKSESITETRKLFTRSIAILNLFRCKFRSWNKGVLELGAHSSACKKSYLKKSFRNVRLILATIFRAFVQYCADPMSIFFHQCKDHSALKGFGTMTSSDVQCMNIITIYRLNWMLSFRDSYTRCSYTREWVDG